MTCCGLKIKENYHVLVNQFHGNFRSKTLSCKKIRFVFREVKWCFDASWGLKGSIVSHAQNRVCNHKALSTTQSFFNPLTAGAVHIRFSHFILTHYISAFKPVKDKKVTLISKIWIFLPPFCQIWIILTHLKLWIASARHNFKWVKIPIE